MKTKMPLHCPHCMERAASKSQLRRHISMVHADNIDPTAIPIALDPTTQRMTGIARHGMTPFDVPYISEVADNLWQGGCLPGLVLPKFIEHLVSLYQWGAYKVTHELESVLIVKMYDSIEQSTEGIDSIARWVNAKRKEGIVLVHCQAGLNRSSLIAARALMLEGMTAPEAIDTLRTKRSPAVLCNPAFEEYLRAL